MYHYFYCCNAYWFDSCLSVFLFTVIIVFAGKGTHNEHCIADARFYLLVSLVEEAVTPVFH